MRVTDATFCLHDCNTNTNSALAEEKKTASGNILPNTNTNNTGYNQMIEKNII